jgi:hypothetical protein
VEEFNMPILIGEAAIPDVGVNLEGVVFQTILKMGETLWPLIGGFLAFVVVRAAVGDRVRRLVNWDYDRLVRRRAFDARARETDRVLFGIETREDARAYFEGRLPRH